MEWRPVLCVTTRLGLLDVVLLPSHLSKDQGDGAAAEPGSGAARQVGEADRGRGAALSAEDDSLGWRLDGAGGWGDWEETAYKEVVSWQGRTSACDEGKGVGRRRGRSRPGLEAGGGRGRRRWIAFACWRPRAGVLQHGKRSG